MGTRYIPNCKRESSPSLTPSSKPSRPSSNFEPSNFSPAAREPDRNRSLSRVAVLAPLVFNSSPKEKNFRFSVFNCRFLVSVPGAVTSNYRCMRCAQFGLWQGARRAHTPQWVCNRRATQPQAKFGATRRAAVLQTSDARSLQIHCGICSSLAPRLAKKSLAAHVSIIRCHGTNRRVMGAWWPSRSSKPLSARFAGRGKFDSYPLRQLFSHVERRCGQCRASKFSN